MLRIADELGSARRDEPLNVLDYEALARERLEPGCWAYYAGGAGDEWTLRENLAAFRALACCGRACSSTSAACRRATTVLGHELVAAARRRAGGLPPDGASRRRAGARAGRRRARAPSTALSTMATASAAEVAAAAPGTTRWFQLYVFTRRGADARSVVDAGARGRLHRARADRRHAAARATASGPGAGRLHDPGRRSPAPRRRSAGADARRRRSAFRSISPSVDAGVTSSGSPRCAGLPVVLKGMLTAEDATARGRARRRRGRRLEPRRPPARRRRRRRSTRCPRSSRRSPAASRCSSTAASAAARTSSRRSRSAPAPCSRVARLSVGPRRPAASEGAARVLELLRAETELALALVGARVPATRVSRPRPCRRT